MPLAATRSGSGWERSLSEKIPYRDIARLSDRSSAGSWISTEQWANTSQPARRPLIICRRAGLFPNLLITPRDRHAFRRQLRDAIYHATQNVAFAPQADDADPKA